jgi:hypothetical protein
MFNWFAKRKEKREEIARKALKCQTVEFSVPAHISSKGEGYQAKVPMLVGDALYVTELGYLNDGPSAGKEAEMVLERESETHWKLHLELKGEKKCST